VTELHQIHLFFYDRANR